MYIGGHYHCIYSYDNLLVALDHTKKAGGNLIQIFNGDNTSTTKNQKAKLTPSKCKDIKKLIKKLKMNIYIHASLSLNLANPLIGRYRWILDNLIYDMNFAKSIGAKAVTVHLGTKFKDRYLLKKYDEKSINEEALKNMAKSLEYVIKHSDKSNVKLLIETSAGQKNKIGTSLAELSKIYHKIGMKYRKKIGFTVDTCHIYSAGYDIRAKDGWKEYLKLFQKYIGIKKIYLIHLNDSKRELNSHTDLHDNLMNGYIFKNNLLALKNIVKWAEKHEVPMVLETRDLSKYKHEIKLIKSL